MEYPTTRELAGKEFLDLHGTVTGTYVAFEDPAYLYSYIIYGHEQRLSFNSVFAIYIPGKGLNSSILEKSSIWITSRVMARDEFMTYSPSWRDIVENTTKLYTTSHNKVYDNGWPEYILTPG